MQASVNNNLNLIYVQLVLMFSGKYNKVLSIIIEIEMVIISTVSIIMVVAMLIRRTWDIRHMDRNLGLWSLRLGNLIKRSSKGLLIIWRKMGSRIIIWGIWIIMQIAWNWNLHTKAWLPQARKSQKNSQSYLQQSSPQNK